MSSKVESLQRASLRDPVRISVSRKYQTVASLVQNYVFKPRSSRLDIVCHVNFSQRTSDTAPTPADKYKDLYLVYLIDKFDGQTMIIFCRTVNETQRLAILLRTLGKGTVPLHGGLSQTARLGALNKFRAGSRSILVATDVAARGLDIPNVDCVINFDVPQDSKTYIHRVGRTARAGKSGHAINILTQ